jgi:hypothetical protein
VLERDNLFIKDVVHPRSLVPIYIVSIFGAIETFAAEINGGHTCQMGQYTDRYKNGYLTSLTLLTYFGFPLTNGFPFIQKR